MNRLVSFLGLVRKSGRLSLGGDCVKQAMIEKKSELLVVACDVSERSLTKFKKLANSFNVDTLLIRESMKDLETMLGKKIGLISINDKKLAKKIIELEETVYDEKVSSTRSCKRS